MKATRFDTRIILFVLFFSFLSSNALAASFDCAKATTPPEKMVCVDPDLSAADTTLMNAYKKALAAVPNKERLKDEQREWVKTRDACPDFACMKKLYRERIAALEKMAASNPNPQAKEETFKIQNASNRYDVTLKIAECGGEQQSNDPNTCNGPASVSLYKKGGRTPFQVIELPNAEIYKDTIAYNPKINTKERGLYEEEYNIVFEDFNFDGEEDLAICNGRMGGYGSPSYNVYLFDKNSNKFTENKKLTSLASDYLGLFMVDSKNKLLTAFFKSGCCYHTTEKYQIVNNNPVLIEKIIEDATGGGDTTLVTTKKLVDGKWVKRVRKVKNP